MSDSTNRGLLIPWRGVWIVAGLLAGMAVSTLWPHAPLRASATDRYENFVVCTGALDEEVEGAFFLDPLTGELKCIVLNLATGKFGGVYTRNVMADLQLQPGGDPRYLMVTGYANLRRTGGNVRPSAAIVYVFEATTGNMAAYAVPWAGRNTPVVAGVAGALHLLDVAQIRTTVVRDQ